MAKRKNAAHHFSGGFAGIPRIIMDNPDYINLSGNAVKLLNELARQFKGKNNGDLTTAYSVLKSRGFKSKDSIKRGRDELITANLIMETRLGLFTNPGGRCSLYALTWQPIDECQGKLDVKETRVAPRIFSMENKTPRPIYGPGSSLKPGRQRQRDGKGRYSSSLKSGRLVVVA